MLLVLLELLLRLLLVEAVGIGVAAEVLLVVELAFVDLMLLLRRFRLTWGKQD